MRINWLAIRDYVMARAREKSTWKALTTAAVTFAGMSIDPERAELIATIGVSVASMFLIQTKEK